MQYYFTGSFIVSILVCVGAALIISTSSVILHQYYVYILGVDIVIVIVYIDENNVVSTRTNVCNIFM